MQPALVISVLAIICIILLWFEVNAIKRGPRPAVSRVVIAMELRRQMDMPAMQAAIAQVRHLGDHAHLGNGHGANGHLSNGHAPSLNGHAANDETQALAEVDQFFAHVGELVRRGIADDEVFVLMGSTIRDMWHIMRPHRYHPIAENGVSHLDDFDYLYTEWLNWDHYHHAHTPQRHFTVTGVSNGVVASTH